MKVIKAMKTLTVNEWMLECRFNAEFRMKFYHNFDFFLRLEL